eukprot:c22879_g1_i2 orf=195-497(+)
MNVPFEQNPVALQHSDWTLLIGPVQPVLHSAALSQLAGQVQMPTGDVIDGAPLSQPKSRAPVLEMNTVGQLTTEDQHTLKTKHKEAEEAERKDHRTVVAR